MQRNLVKFSYVWHALNVAKGMSPKFNNLFSCACAATLPGRSNRHGSHTSGRESRPPCAESSPGRKHASAACAWSPRNRSGAGGGLVHFSARRRVSPINGWPKTWACPLRAAQGGQSHFRGENQIRIAGFPAPRKLGQSPVDGYGTHWFTSVLSRPNRRASPAGAVGGETKRVEEEKLSTRRQEAESPGMPVAEND